MRLPVLQPPTTLSSGLRWIATSRRGFSQQPQPPPNPATTSVATSYRRFCRQQRQPYTPLSRSSIEQSRPRSTVAGIYEEMEKEKTDKSSVKVPKGTRDWVAPTLRSETVSSRPLATLSPATVAYNWILLFLSSRAFSRASMG